MVPYVADFRFLTERRHDAAMHRVDSIRVIPLAEDGHRVYDGIEFDDSWGAITARFDVVVGPEGAKYGHLVGPNGKTGDELRGLTAHDVFGPKIAFVWDGAAASEGDVVPFTVVRSDDPSVSRTDTLRRVPIVEVQPPVDGPPSSVARGDSAIVFLEPERPPGDLPVNVSLDADGARYGDLVGPDATRGDALSNILYGALRDGLVYYEIDGELEPDQAHNPRRITVTAENAQDASGNGWGKVWVGGHMYEVTADTALSEFYRGVPLKIAVHGREVDLTALAIDGDSNKVALPEEWLVNLFVEGGHFIAADSLYARRSSGEITEDYTDQLWGVEYGDVRAGLIKYLADPDIPADDSLKHVFIWMEHFGEYPDDWENEYWDYYFGWEFVTVVKPYFEVEALPDTVALRDTARVHIEVIDKSHPSFAGGNFKVDVEMDRPELGRLVRQQWRDSLWVDRASGAFLKGVPYEVVDSTHGASDERIVFVASAHAGQPGGTLGDVRITVIRSDDVLKRGSGEIVIEGTIEILDPGGDVAKHLRIARWDNAYTGPPTYSVRNSAGNHFIDRDPEHFIVRLTDPDANQNAGVKETVRAEIRTVHPKGGDAPTEIELEETGANTGVFLSETQLMTSPDLPVPATPDDDFAAHDGKSGPVPDDALNDRTHKAHIGGMVKVEYQSGGKTLKARANVCHPDSIRTLDVKVVVFNEPYKDTGYVTVAGDVVGAGNGVFDFADLNGNGRHDAGEPSEEYIDLSVYKPVYDSTGALINLPPYLSGDDPESAGGDGHGPVSSEAYIQKQIRRSNVAWTQACIRVEQVGSTRVEEAPTDGQGKSILEDGIFAPLRDGEAQIVYNAYQTEMMNNIAYVFFQGPVSGSYAIAYPPAHRRFSHGAHSFTFVGHNLDPAYRTLAHEIGHLLSNRGDAPNPKPIFFPALYTIRGGDVAVNSYRRITLDTMIKCRTVRPAGNLNATGNRLLHN